jgi:hypothetical protein
VIPPPATLALLVLVAAGCFSREKDDGDKVPSRPFPRVPGLAATAVATDRPAPADDRLGPPPPGCQSGDPVAVSVTADVAPAAGAETVVASAAHGVVVFDGEGRRLGAVAFPCGGSADAIDALAVGDAGIGAPVIAVIATAGGRRETTTRVELLAFRELGLERLFAGAIETTDGDIVRSGEVRIAPPGLVHRDPSGVVSTLRADVWSHRFVLDPPAPPAMP